MLFFTMLASVGVCRPPPDATQYGRLSLALDLAFRLTPGWHCWSDLAKAKAENVLLLKLVASKDKLVQLLQMELDNTTLELVQAVARKSAVICNRVLLETGLRSRSYDPRLTFPVRYDIFKSQEVLAEDGQLSITAQPILQEIPQQYQVKPTDIKKEMKGLDEQISMPFH